MTTARRRNAGFLRAGLADIEGLLMPPEPPEGFDHVYHQFTVRATPDASIDRDSAVEAIVDAGVGAGVYYPKVVYDYDCYRDHLAWSRTRCRSRNRSRRKCFRFPSTSI